MGRISRFGVYVGDYMKRLYRDYKFSLVDAKEMCTRRRGRTGFALGTIATAVYAMNTNPDMQDYHDALAERRCMLASTINRNDGSVNMLDSTYAVPDCQDRVWRINLFVCSLFVNTPYALRSSNYSADNKHMQPSYLSYVRDRLIDVGCMGQFYNLRTRFDHQFDVEFDNFNHSLLPQNVDYIR